MVATYMVVGRKRRGTTMEWTHWLIITTSTYHPLTSLVKPKSINSQENKNKRDHIKSMFLEPKKKSYRL